MTAKPKIPRQPMGEQSAEERIKNFNEVPLGYDEQAARLEASRCIQCKNPKCVEGCPVLIDIPGFIKKIEDGDFLGAAAVLKLENSLPAICGRVCPQEDQCEIKCILGIKGEPVAIGRLERFAADYERASGKISVPKIKKSSGKQVAVVGSGPAGLTCAADLAKLGHKVSLFEALHKAGGVLVYGIPEFRLPKAIVESEVDFLRQLGVEVTPNVIIGKLFTIDELFKKGYHAVFIATGAGAPMFMNLPGENLNGVYSANEFLTRMNLMKAYRFPEFATPIPPLKRVAVLGGGNTAMDAARCSRRMGAEVHVLYRRSRTEMPARIEEIEHAEEEGVKFEYLATPLAYSGDENGWLKSARCQRMELGEPDDSGRRRPVPIEGSEYELELDTVVVSIGTNANPLIQQTTPDLEVNKWGNILADETTLATSKRGVYAGGDIVTGGATVILAAGAGKVAARSIDEFLTK